MPPQRRALQEISRNSSRRPNLTSKQRAQIITLSKASSKAAELTTQFNVAPKTIYQTLN